MTALIGACSVVTAMLVWVLWRVLHGQWPLVLEVVLKRLDIVGTAVIGLLGVLVLAIVVAAIRANISITAGDDTPGAPVAQVTTTTRVAQPMVPSPPEGQAG